MKTKIIAVVMLFLIYISSVSYAESEMTSADRDKSIRAYQDAQAFFEAYEDLLQEASSKMLELGTDSLEIHYPKNEDGTYSAEVWAKKGDDYEKTTIREYLDILSIPVEKSEGRVALPIYKMVRYGDVIDVKLWDYYNVDDFLRVNEHGFYYLSCSCCENEELEKSLEKHMPEYWDFCLSVQDQFEYERVSDHFVYYHWLG